MNSILQHTLLTALASLSFTFPQLALADLSIASSCRTQNCRELEWTVPSSVDAVTDLDCTLKLKPLDENAYFELHFLSFYSLDTQVYTWLNRPSFSVPQGEEYPLIPKELQTLDNEGNLTLYCHDLPDNVYLKRLKEAIRPGTYRVLLSDAEPDGQEGIFGVMYSLQSFTLDLKTSGGRRPPANHYGLLLKGSTLGITLNGMQEHTYIFYHNGGQATLVTSGEADTYLLLKDMNDQLIAEDDDGAGVNRNAKIDRDLASGYYLLSVRGYNDSVTGNCVLTVGPDPGYSLGGWLSPGNTYRAALGADHVKYVPFYQEAPGWVTFETHPTYSNLDTTLSLYDRDPNGSLLGFDDDSGEGNNSLLRIYLQPGAYVVGIRGYQDAVGDFELTVQ